LEVGLTGNITPISPYKTLQRKDPGKMETNTKLSKEKTRERWKPIQNSPK